MSQQTYQQERYLDTLVALGLVLFATLLYLPALGTYPLWDPWEAHYSQVAMEMVQHNSWWEPWYRESTRSFWSKPIFTFWLMIGSLKTFRIEQVGDFAQAEFYLRMPIAVFGAVGIGFVYYFVRRLWNRRTGVIVALILTTCPQYFLIARQVMVDVPFVVIQTIALGFFALGLFNLRPLDTLEERKSGVRTFALLAGLFLLFQIIELAYWRFKLLPVPTWSQLLSFQKLAWQREAYSWSITWQQGSVLWISIAAFLALWAVVRAYTQDPGKRAFVLFFFFSGLGFLAKGLLSIVVPGGAVIFYILLTRDWDLLRRMGLFYDSPTLNGTTTVLLGSLASLLAVWFITYPMMPEATRQMQNNTNHQLRQMQQNVARLQLQHTSNKQRQDSGTGFRLFVQQQSVKYLQWQQNTLGSVHQFYSDFRNRMTLPQQIVSFAAVVLLLALFSVLLAGQSRGFAWAFLLTGGVFLAVLSQVTRLKPYFANYPLVTSLVVLLFVLTGLTFAWSKQPDWQQSLPYYGGLSVLLLIAVVHQFFPFEKFLQKGAFVPPVLVFFSIFTIGFIGIISLLVATRQADKTDVSALSYPTLTWFLVGASTFLFFALQPRILPGLNPNATFSILLLLTLVGLLGLYRSGQSREHLKAFFLSGAVIYLIVAGSWVFVMCYKHGLPFMQEWFIYHHFQRIQGVIEKPNDSFDLYIRQIGFGMFPWAAFLPIALIRFLRWNQADVLEEKMRRNIFFLCCFFFPYFFYTFSSTKFHHYVFPVVPFLAIIAGVWLSSLFREDGIRQERLGLAASFLLFVLLAKDLMTNYKPLHQLFTYYTNRQTPGDVYPRNFFLLVFALFGIVLLLIVLSRKLRYYQFAFLMIPTAIFVLFVNVKLIPAVAPNFSFKSLIEAYQKHDRGRKLPFGEYSNWDERSTSYYSKNFSRYLGRDNEARSFLRQATEQRPVFIMVSRHQIPTLRDLAKAEGKKIYIIDRKHYEMWLVSTKQPEGARGIESVRFSQKPALPGPYWRPVNIDFGGKARLIAVRLDKPYGYRRGDKAEIRFLFHVTGKFTKDWKVFIHADPVKWTRHRLNWDHEMAEGLYPTSEWKKGEYVQDIFERTIPRDYPSHYNNLNIYMGLWLGNNRVPITYANVYNDGQNRALPVRLKLLP